MEYICFNKEGIISNLNGGLQKLEKLKYLSSCISSTESDVNMRLKKAWTVIYRLSIIWKSDLSVKIKWVFLPSNVFVNITVHLTLSNIRHTRCSSYWKGSHLVAHDYSRQLYLTFYIELNLISHWASRRGFSEDCLSSVPDCQCSMADLKPKGSWLRLGHIQVGELHHWHFCPLCIALELLSSLSYNQAHVRGTRFGS